MGIPAVRDSRSMRFVVNLGDPLLHRLRREARRQLHLRQVGEPLATPRGDIQGVEYCLLWTCDLEAADRAVGCKPTEQIRLDLVEFVRSHGSAKPRPLPGGDYLNHLRDLLDHRVEDE